MGNTKSMTKEEIDEMVDTHRKELMNGRNPNTMSQAVKEQIEQKACDRTARFLFEELAADDTWCTGTNYDAESVDIMKKKTKSLATVGRSPPSPPNAVATKLSLLY